MDYQINYPITQLPGEVIALHYTKGFKSVLAEYKDEVLFEDKNISDLRRGVVVNHPVLGKLEFKFAKEKMVVNVIVEGIHSPINKDHPRQKVKSFATYLWILVGFTGLGFIVDLIAAINIPLLIVFILGPVFAAVALSIYILSAVKLRKAKTMFFWTGFGMFLLRYMFYCSLPLFGLEINGFLLGVVIRSMYLIAFIVAIPMMLKYRKYEIYATQARFSGELLDEQF